MNVSIICANHIENAKKNIGKLFLSFKVSLTHMKAFVDFLLVAYRFSK